MQLCVCFPRKFWKERCRMVQLERHGEALPTKFGQQYSKRNICWPFSYNYIQGILKHTLQIVLKSTNLFNSVDL